jgi:hypothetical protein
MSDVHRNPETEPQDEEYEYRQNDAADYPTEIAGPGGRTTNIENNERGVLDAVVFRALATHKQAELGSSHNSHRQGIYSQDVKYGD